MQSALSALAALTDQQDKRRFERAGPWGVSPKYYTVEDEHDIEVVELLVGSAFVLGQAAITQAVSIIKKIREKAGKPPCVPCEKRGIMELVAPVHNETGLSKITIIDAAANYSKHHYEWSDDWSGPPGSKPTIDIVVKLGLGPKGYHNLEHALRELGMLPNNILPLAQLVGQWRAQLAAHIRKELSKRSL